MLSLCASKKGQQSNYGWPMNNQGTAMEDASVASSLHHSNERKHERIRSLSPEPATRKSGSRNRKNTQIEDPFKPGIWNPDTQESEGELPSEEAEVKTGPDLVTDQY